MKFIFTQSNRSFAKASIEHDIAVLNLSDRGLTDDRLGALFAKAPLNSIILLEDIDAAFGSRDAAIKVSKLFQ
jgi:chaperone BCS1